MEVALLEEEGSAQGEPLRYDCVVGAQCRAVVPPRTSWTLPLLLDQLQLLPGEESPLLVSSNSREASSEASVRVGTFSRVKARIKVRVRIGNSSPARIRTRVRIGNSSPARIRTRAAGRSSQTRTKVGSFSPARTRTRAEKKDYFLSRAQVPTKAQAATFQALISRSPTSAQALKLSKALALALDNTNSPLVNPQPARVKRLWKPARMSNP